MAIKREIKWVVAADGAVTPTTPLDGGAQGDHNQTRAIFEVAEGSAWADPANAVYIECDDGAGNVDTTEQLTVVDGKVSYLIPRAWTQYGGTVTLRLVAEGPGVGDVQCYSAEARARLDSRQNAMDKVAGLLKGRVATMEKRANDALSGAEAAQEAAQESVEQAEQYAKSCYNNSNAAKEYAKKAEAAATATAVNASAAQGATAAAEKAADDAGQALVRCNNHSLRAENAAAQCGQYATAAEKAADDAGQALVRCNNHSLRAESAATQCGQYATAAEAAAKRAEAAGGGGITVDDVKPFRFTVTKTGKKYKSSKTYEEIVEVLNAGNRLVICEYNSLELQFAGMIGDNLYFHTGAWGGDIYVCVDSFGVRVITESDPITVVNVLDYDAVGDGVTDDTDAIQDALYDAEEKGLPLYFPTGTYLVSSTITTHTRDTDADKQTNNLVIYGDGFGTVIKTTEDFDGDYVFYIDVAGVQPRSLWVHDFAIDLYADVSGIYFEEIGMKSVVENLWITFKYLKQETDTKVREGIFCNSATVSTFQLIKVMGNIRGLDGKRKTNCGIVVNGMHSGRIIDCDVSFCGWGIYLSGGSNNVIENCRIDENEYGIYQNSSTDVNVETRAYAVGELADAFKGTFSNLTISKNRFEANNKAAIFLIAYSAGELNYMYNAQITIDNNDFSGLGKGTARWHDDRGVFRKAIWLGRCKGVVISANTFKGMPYESATVETTDAMGNVETHKATNQNVGIATSVEHLTLRDNVAITWPLWSDDTNYTIVKTNTKISTDLVQITNFVNDIEANQTVGKVNACVYGSRAVTIKSGGEIDVSSSNVFALKDGVEVTGLTVYTGDTEYTHDVTFIAIGETATIKNTNRIRLDGGVDFVMGEFDTVTLARVYVYPRGYFWVEKSRSVNRAT